MATGRELGHGGWMDVIVSTKIHESWKDASPEERKMFATDLCRRYRPLIKEILKGKNETDGELQP